MDRLLLEKINAVTDCKLMEEAGLPDRKEIVYMLKEAQVVLFPEFYSFSELSQEEAFVELRFSLEKEIRLVKERLCQECNCPGSLAERFMEQLPEVKRLLLTDIQAIYDGDPAARSKAEIVLCYPGFYAICIHRLAHVLYELGIPYIPRVMSEYAHEKTGIDINPGASIGEAFCIDHGTGIVIGETAVIGRHVKLYQGVTIGARSFQLDEEGNPVKSGKRHPDIGDDVIIYANATILGGDTHVGDRSVIGGSVWLIHSVPEDTRLYYRD